MQYFSTLPKVVQFDSNLNSRVFTNLLARASIVPTLLDNPLIYYTYDIQDGDTPEIIANKYYGDVYRYWIVLYCNQLNDPLWDWPLSNQEFDIYMKDKYQNLLPNSTTHHYEKIVTQYDVSTLTTTVNTVNISQTEYSNLLETTKTYNLPTGQVTVTTSKKAVTYYEYELALNESKRSIKLLNKNYVDQLEKEFKNLMSK